MIKDDFLSHILISSMHSAVGTNLLAKATFVVDLLNDLCPMVAMLFLVICNAHPVSTLGVTPHARQRHRLTIKES